MPSLRSLCLVVIVPAPSLSQGLHIDACKNHSLGETCSFAGALNTVQHGTCMLLGSGNHSRSSCVPEIGDAEDSRDPNCERGRLHFRTGACCPSACEDCVVSGVGIKDACSVDFILRMGPRCSVAAPPCLVSAAQGVSATGFLDAGIASPSPVPSVFVSSTSSSSGKDDAFLSQMKSPEAIAFVAGGAGSIFCCICWMLFFHCLRSYDDAEEEFETSRQTTGEKRRKKSNSTKNKADKRKHKKKKEIDAEIVDQCELKALEDDAAQFVVEDEVSAWDMLLCLKRDDRVKPSAEKQTFQEAPITGIDMQGSSDTSPQPPTIANVASISANANAIASSSASSSGPMVSNCDPYDDTSTKQRKPKRGKAQNKKCGSKKDATLQRLSEASTTAMLSYGKSFDSDGVADVSLENEQKLNLDDDVRGRTLGKTNRDHPCDAAHQHEAANLGIMHADQSNIGIQIDSAKPDPDPIEEHHFLEEGNDNLVAKIENSDANAEFHASSSSDEDGPDVAVLTSVRGLTSDLRHDQILDMTPRKKNCTTPQALLARTPTGPSRTKVITPRQKSSDTPRSKNLIEKKEIDAAADAGWSKMDSTPVTSSETSTSKDDKWQSKWNDMEMDLLALDEDAPLARGSSHLGQKWNDMEMDLSALDEDAPLARGSAHLGTRS